MIAILLLCIVLLHLNNDSLSFQFQRSPQHRQITLNSLELFSQKTDVADNSKGPHERKISNKRSDDTTNDSFEISNENDSNPDEFLKFTGTADSERLQKVIARAGIASRREAEKMIEDGRVAINGKIVTELGCKVKPRKDIILVDGKKVVLPDSKDVFWIMLNKPKSIISTISDAKNRDTIASLFPKAKELRLLPVGGLDRDATGLLLLTNDNGWIHPLTHPSFKPRRRYQVVVRGIPTEEDLTAFNDRHSKPDAFKIPEIDELVSKPSKIIGDAQSPIRGIAATGNSPPTTKLTSHEGIVRKAKRVQQSLCEIKLADIDRVANMSLLEVLIEETTLNQLGDCVEAIKCTLISYKRIEFGPLKLKTLKRGAWRELTPGEIKSLKQSCLVGKK